MRTVTVTILREVDIEVTVGHRPGSPQTFTDPGDPDEWWIKEATHNGRPIELDGLEAEEAVEQAATQMESREDPDPIDPDPDTDDGIDELSVMGVGL